MRLFLLLGVVLWGVLLGQFACASDAQHVDSYLEMPPFYVNNERDFPLTIMDVTIPKPGVTLPDFDFSTVSADHWRQNGNAVQPSLDLEVNWLRLGVLHGLRNGWAAGLSIPWYRNQVVGFIGGQPASGIAEGFGNIDLIAKKRIWSGCQGQRIVLAAALELPTGQSASIFGPSNFVTNAYYTNFPRRIPLGWQASTGTWNGLLSASYGRNYKRFSYEGILAGKLYSADDEGVKVGDLFIAAVDGTYGITRDLAGSVGFTLRSQADDDYPQAPPPGVGQPALAGTTTNGAFVYMDFSLRYKIRGRAVIGVGIRTPITTPSNGMVPTTLFSIIFSPTL